MKKKSLSIVLFLIMIGSLVACATPVALDTPTNLSINGTVFSWSDVEGAENGYTVKVNNTEIVVEKGKTNLDFSSGTVMEHIVYGENEIMIKTNAVSDMLLESEYSEVIIYTKSQPITPPDSTKLSKPSNIRTDKLSGKIVWDKVNGASGYRLYFSGAIGEKEASTNEFKITNFASGEYSVSILAVGTGNFISSEKSTIFTFSKLATPQVTFDAQKGKLEWTSINAATQYLVIDGSKETLTTSTAYVAAFVGDDIAKRFIKVIAKGGSNSFDSDATTDFAVERLSKPTGLAFNETTKTFSWNPVQNASGYKLTVNQVDYYETATSMTIAALPNETFSVQLVAMHEDYVTSSYSDLTVQINPLPQLDKIQSINIDDANKKLTWDSVSNATKYSVKINSLAEQIITKAEFAFDNKPSGDYTVTINALADGFAASEGTVKQFKVLGSPTLTFDHENSKVVWSAVEGSIGYVVKDGTELPQSSSLEYVVNFIAGNNDIQNRQIQVKAIADSNNFSSGFISVTVKKLAKVANLAYDDNFKKLTFDASLEQGVSYRVLINDVLHDTVNDNYIVLDLNSGTYSIEVYAVKDGLVNGDKSDSISITIKNSLARVTGFSYDSTNKQLTWDAVDGAENGYSIIINDDSDNAETVSGTSLVISNYSAGVYSFKIFANATSINSSSEVSESVDVTVVGTIEIGLSKDTGELTVSSEYASEITVTVNGNPTTLTNGKISLAGYTAGVHAFVFTSKASGNYIGSSRTQTVTIIQTAATLNAKVSINKFIFDKLENHTYNIAYGNVSTNLDNNYSIMPTGTYPVTLVAKKVSDDEFTYVKESVLTNEITIKEGTKASKYDVSSEIDFANMLAMDGKYFIQTADIEFNEVFTHTTFNGNYDGGGYSLGSQSKPLTFVNIFGLNQGTISNLKVYINATNNEMISEVGGIVGVNTGFIDNVEVFGSITSTTAACLGGVVGKSERDVTNSINRANVTGSKVVGGISGVVEKQVGAAEGGYVQGCKNYGNISASGDTVGGIIGFSQRGYLISSCFNYGAVSGASNVGGIVGSNAESKDGSDGIKIEKSGNEGDITATGNNAGGISGYQRYADILVSYNKGSISANENAGGIVGSTNATQVRYCYNTGTITVQTQNVGGIAGAQYNWGTNPDLNKSKVGGSYNVGNIVANSATNKGYICGVNNDTYTSFYLDSLAVGLNNDGWQVVSKTEADMKLQAFVDELNAVIAINTDDTAYVGCFTLDTENINNGYPIFSYPIVKE